MAQLSRNTKIGLLIVGVVIVVAIFFRFLIGIIILTAIIGFVLYIFYKGIRQKIDKALHTPSNPRERLKENMQRAKAMAKRNRDIVRGR